VDCSCGHSARHAGDPRALLVMHAATEALAEKERSVIEDLIVELLREIQRRK
jgi:hypothetical protein